MPALTRCGPVAQSRRMGRLLYAIRSPSTKRWLRGNLLVWLHDQRIRSYAFVMIVSSTCCFGAGISESYGRRLSIAKFLSSTPEGGKEEKPKKQEVKP